MPYTYDEIKELTAKNFGISASSLGESFVKDSLDKYLSKIDVQDSTGKITNSEKFLDGFFEYIKVPETWFFRQPESFEFLKTTVLKKLQTKDNKIRILSIPCSTGEEPYSIAMSLESAGIDKARYTLDAADLSAVSIIKAKEAVYGKNSFRQALSRVDHEFFIKEGNLNRVREDIRAIPNFMIGNFLKPEFLLGVEKYDIIFCRNLLIYFTDSARQAAINKIKELLTDDGLVFTGYSEFVFFLQNGFKDLEQKLSFACYIDDKISQAKIIPHRKKSNLPRPMLKPTAYSDIIKKESISNEEIADKSWELEFLANAGDLEEAKIIAQRVLDGDTGNSKELTISGAVFSACNMDTEAITCLERAIYLNPNEDDALIHLSLIYENSGKKEQAELLKKRIRKINAKEAL
jgi:chemotaxis protein methyltransferase WspC